MEKTKKVFRSRVSVLLIVLLILVPFLAILKHNTFIGFIIFFGVMWFPVLLFIGMKYVISDDKLFLPLGSVNIADIVSVERSYNPLSAPAASLKRLRIGFGRKAKYPYTLISPVKEQEFIEELKKINPDIYVKISDKKGIWRIWDWDI